MEEWELIDLEETLNPQAKRQKAPRIESVRDLVIFENDDYLVVNKPPYVSTLDERAEGFGEGLLRMMKKEYGDVQACHRLDKETSGCLAFAKHPEAYRSLAMQFEHRQVTKIYHALAQGVHRFEGIRVYLPIRPTRDGIAVIDTIGGKEAETIFNTLKVYRGFTLVECYPITGRLHQIRVHLKQLKAPIVTDELYGGKPIYLSNFKRNFNLKDGTLEQPLIQRVALHARRLNFELMSGERLDVEAPYPKDFMALLKQLEKAAL